MAAAVRLRPVIIWLKTSCHGIEQIIEAGLRILAMKGCITEGSKGPSPSFGDFQALWKQPSRRPRMDSFFLQLEKLISALGLIA